MLPSLVRFRIAVLERRRAARRPPAARLHARPRARPDALRRARASLPGGPRRIGDVSSPPWIERTSSAATSRPAAAATTRPRSTRTCARVADEIERLRERRPPRGRRRRCRRATSEQVRAILEAAERGAAELRAEAGARGAASTSRAWRRPPRACWPSSTRSQGELERAARRAARRAASGSPRGWRALRREVGDVDPLPARSRAGSREPPRAEPPSRSRSRAAPPSRARRDGRRGRRALDRAQHGARAARRARRPRATWPSTSRSPTPTRCSTTSTRSAGR